MKVDLADTERLVSLYQNGKSLLSFVDERLPYVRNPQSTNSGSDIDKHDDGFFYEDACQSMNIRGLCYKSFTGSFGCSSTYSDISSIDKELMKKYFMEYLNKHKDDIIRGMAQMMIQDAREMKAKAICEIDRIRRKIDKIFPDNSDEENNVQ